jgi:drug/metabolite transporter (DMT)-like permease
MEYVGPFTFNGVRFILGSLSLIPLILWQNRKTPGRALPGRGEPPRTGAGAEGKRFLRSSLIAGTCLFIAVALQQLGIMFTTAGNAGFITGLYVVFTPVFGIFLGKKTGLPTWIGAVCTLTGMYFLSAAGQPGAVNPGDLITAVSAVFWAFHVLLIDRLVTRTDPLLLSSGQFAWCGLYSLAAAFLIEPFLGGWISALAPEMLSSGLFTWETLPAILAGLGTEPAVSSRLANSLIPILYGGLASVGIAYTLQVVAQRDAPPAHATIILCLEGSFAAIGGVLILDEPLGPQTFLAFVLMFTGMLITQWEVIFRGRVKRK